MSATMSIGDHVAALRLPAGVNLDTSTLATRSYSSSLGVIIPSLELDLLERDVRSRKLRSIGSLRTDLGVNVYKAPEGWHDKVSMQQEFIRAQDAATRRIWFMYREGRDDLGMCHG